MNDRSSKRPDALPVLEELDPELIEGCILSHGSLARQPDRTLSESENYSAFAVDLRKGRLNPFVGSNVAYQKGVMVGHCPSKELLFREAGFYYGTSSLGVFPVPDDFVEPRDEFLGVF